MEEFEEKLECINDYLDNIDEKIVKLNEDKLNLINEQKNINRMVRAIYNDSIKYKEVLLKETPKPIINFTCHLVEHCNLGCKGCDHFAPLANERFTDIKLFENDMKRMAELFNGQASRIGLLGGEPLLHPEAAGFAAITRKYFPYAKIRIITNGLLLLKQNKEFWNICRENNIIIEMTKYPVNIKIDEIEDVAHKEKVQLQYFANSKRVLKTSYFLPLDLDGEQDARDSFRNCFHSNECIMLKDGKIFTCTIAPNIEHFNKFFGTNLVLTSDDYINIYEVESGKEVLKFLSKPIPFCRYCNVRKRSFGHPWEQSRGIIDEWVL